MEQSRIVPLDTQGGLDLTVVAAACRVIDQIEAPDALPAALLQEANALVGSAGVVVDREGRVLAATPDDAAEQLTRDHPGFWEGPAGQARTLTDAQGRLLITVRVRLEQDADYAIVLAGPAGQAIEPDRLMALQMIAAFTRQRSLYLAARLEAEESRRLAATAHEQQMEMALKLYDLYEEAQTQAITDGLTGLATHDFFQSRLNEELAEAHRYQKPLSLIIFDLDHFKPINDTYGHQAGDTVLKETAALLRASLRTTDLVARYGGEEFAIILPHTGGEDAYQLADRLRRDLEATQIAISEARKLRVTASIGVAAASDQDALPKDLIKRADTALYAAKNGGRNRVVMAQGPVMEAVSAIGAPRSGSQEMFYGLARAFSASITARMPMMGGHSEEVGELAARMAEAIGLSSEKQEAMRIAGLLHDIGMMSVPESVILKPGMLEEHEWKAVKDHPAAGVAILARFSTFGGLLEAVLYHHERWDGKGYPEGLAGTAIPMGARIIAICDTYDALIRGDYAFGLGVPPKEARDEIGRCAGTQFDPELVAIFHQVLDQQEEA